MMATLDKELEALASMSRDELVGRWMAAYRNPPPNGVRRELLMYAAGWHIQVKRLGGFSGEVRRMLRCEVERIRRERRVNDGSGAHNSDPREVELHDNGAPLASDGKVTPSAARRKLGPGARLFREWSGRTHIVDVMENGYLYDGTVYRSLSAIARRITGAHWSGPRFFGL